MHQQHSAGKNYLAFTIIELLTVVAIGAILIAAILPGYDNFVRNNESIVIASRLESSLQLARAEAIRQGIPVTVCPITNTFDPQTAFVQTSEQYPCQNSTDWTAWKVFSDPNFNAVENFANGWPIIQYVGDNQQGTISSNIAGPITFDPMGFANINPSATRSGWTWSASYASGEWNWSYAYGSSYSGTYYRVFTIDPPGCSGSESARVLQITQPGVITITPASC